MPHDSCRRADIDKEEEDKADAAAEAEDDDEDEEEEEEYNREEDTSAQSANMLRCIAASLASCICLMVHETNCNGKLGHAGIGKCENGNKSASTD